MRQGRCGPMLGGDRAHNAAQLYDVYPTAFLNTVATACLICGFAAMRAADHIALWARSFCE
jgi:hypothetical protein